MNMEPMATRRSRRRSRATASRVAAATDLGTVGTNHNHNGITTLAVALLALSASISSVAHAFSPTYGSRSPLLHHTHLNALQPGKGGIVVEAKTEFVARDILIDELMGRGADGGGGELNEERDESVPNEEWVFDFSSNKKQSQKQAPRQQQQQVVAHQPAKQQQHMAMPPQSPPPPEEQSARPLVPNNLSSSTPRKTNSKLPDPSLMKLADIQGELSLRRIEFSDCFDRIGLEMKLREGRAAMAAARSMDQGSRRSASSAGGGGGAASYGGGMEVGNGGVIGANTAGRSNAAPPPSQQRRPPAARRPAAPASSRSSAAEQAIFSSSRVEAVRPNRNTNSARSQQPRTQSTRSAAKTTGNPFSHANRNAQRNLRQGENSSSSFRDNAQGVGFGDANSYAGGGSPMAARGGGGDGVRLGKKRTSYGDFNNSGSGSSIGGNFGSSSGGGSSVGGGNSSFRSAGGSTQSFSSGGSSFGGGGGSERGGGSSSFNAGGVSIKGDSSIFSSMGMMGGQGGSTTTFDMGGGGNAGGGSATNNAGRRAATPPPPPPSRPSAPPLDEPQLDFLTQAAPTSQQPQDFSSSNTNEPPSYNSYENDIINDSAPSTPAVAVHSGPPMSQQYAEAGLDPLSGNQPGFGAVQGFTKTGGDSSHRGSAEDVKVPGGGKVGDMGMTMGGDFGGSSTGGASGRSSARYSKGGGFGGIEYED